MLVWKVIAANPGITRAGIWEHVEHGIPEGYALRLYSQELKKRGIPTPDTSSVGISKARGFVLTLRLHHMRQRGALCWTGAGNDRRYTVARELDYKGNAEAIDETGTKAAEHMAVAEALRTVEKMLGRANLTRKYGACVTGGKKDYDALLLVVKALRAKNGT